jgi:hypothetical protein
MVNASSAKRWVSYADKTLSKDETTFRIQCDDILSIPLSLERDKRIAFLARVMWTGTNINLPSKVML